VAKSSKTGKPIEPTSEEWVAILQSLTEQFIHRHKFFWAQYFRIITYQIIILLSPLLLLKAGQISETFPENMAKYLPEITGLFLMIVSGWVGFRQSGESKKALLLEDARVRMVHKTLKKHLGAKKVTFEKAKDLNLEDIEKKDSVGATMIRQYEIFIKLLCGILFLVGLALILYKWLCIEQAHISFHFYL